MGAHCARRHLSPGVAACGRLRVPCPRRDVASSSRRGKEAANWQRGHVLMWPSPRSHRNAADGNAHRAAVGLNGSRGRKRRDAGAARQPRDPSRVPGSPTGFPGRRATGAFRAGWTRPRVADEAPAYPSHPRPFCRGRTARGRKQVRTRTDTLRIRRSCPRGRGSRTAWRGRRAGSTPPTAARSRRRSCGGAPRARPSPGSRCG